MECLQNTTCTPTYMCLYEHVYVYYVVTNTVVLLNFYINRNLYSPFYFQVSTLSCNISSISIIISR